MKAGRVNTGIGRVVLLVALLALLLVQAQLPAQPRPIRVGGTLPLTGVFAAQGKVHEAAGRAFVQMMNEKGGLLGRPLEWVLLDDESQPDKAAALYERLITEDKVDLIIGPYGTAAITAAMRVAEKYGYVFPHHTASLTYAYTYRRHFPTWYVGLNTHITTPSKVFDAYLSLPPGQRPRTVGFVVNKFPGTQFLAYGRANAGGAVRVARQKGLQVVLDVQFDLGTTDWIPVAQQVRRANPDLLYVAGLALDGVNLLQALAQLGWRPRYHFYQWPSPGAMLAALPLTDRATSVTIFVPHEPYLSNPGARDFVNRYRAWAKATGLAYSEPDVQSAASWSAWQVLTFGVQECRCLDHARIAEVLLSKPVPTVQGYLKFDPQQQNYGDDIQAVMQIQDGRWWAVWPRQLAAEGRRLR
ncbi:MAG: amino acid ABC transporter substrate-binding protein [Armatimonadota bacterium]|nr:amino acid ABC transporter substrate-binding protein [Armatimonadota bacterium]MDR7438742.1 amino acid ABC transporter substrate-binding protein [Armatimonadota bacterium]MDR7561958.1 amino acid ABC transporter substrate-binding protein [Armatimonadota bacterium]MDR7566905.1 amino acid ABC transporter substrate-binding protein [Armatimonadota bacterium]